MRISLKPPKSKTLALDGYQAPRPCVDWNWYSIHPLVFPASEALPKSFDNIGAVTCPHHMTRRQRAGDPPGNGFPSGDSYPPPWSWRAALNRPRSCGVAMRPSPMTLPVRPAILLSMRLTAISLPSTPAQTTAPDTDPIMIFLDRGFPPS